MRTLAIECLIQSLSEYLDSKRELDAKRDEHINRGGYSFGYHYRREIEYVEKQAEEFSKRLTEFIDARVVEALEKTVHK